MKEFDINIWETDKERARRTEAQKGQCFNQTKDTAQRWANRERSDEAFARAIGVHVDYADTRSHNTRLLR